MGGGVAQLVVHPFLDQKIQASNPNSGCILSFLSWEFALWNIDLHLLPSPHVTWVVSG